MRNNTNRFNVGLTLLKDGSSDECFFNVYMDWDVDKSICSGQETSTAGFSSTKLNFIPYVLFPTTLPTAEGDETVWLISGSDRRIHIYPSVGSQNRLSDDFTAERAFPEFTKVQGITLYLDLHYVHQRKSRFTLTSGESGNVHLFNVDVSLPKNPKILSSQKVQFDFPSSAVKLFYAFNKKCDIESELGAEKIFESKFSDETEPLALITTTLESCFIHSAEDLDEPAVQLSESENFDVVTSCLICDIDFDGINEIVLGTYGQVVLIYKLVEETHHNWEFDKKLFNFHSPVLSLAYEDILGDGIKELIISTMAGVHVYQTDPENAAALIIQRLRKLNTS
ncbi:Kaptin [Armadillidium vulgare]|nr:Kaptin [Armadillidium vulgare]